MIKKLLIMTPICLCSGIVNSVVWEYVTPRLFSDPSLLNLANFYSMGTITIATGYLCYKITEKYCND